MLVYLSFISRYYIEKEGNNKQCEGCSIFYIEKAYKLKKSWSK